MDVCGRSEMCSGILGMPLIELHPAHGMLELELGKLYDRVKKINFNTENGLSSISICLKVSKHLLEVPGSYSSYVKLKPNVAPP